MKASRRHWPLVPLLVSVAVVAGCGGGSSGGAAKPPVKGSTAAVPTQAPRPSASSQSGRLAGKVIVIDPGHNGGNASHPAIINKLVNVLTERKPCNTTGTATDDGYSEHAFNWDVATRLVKILRAQGAKVVLTRPNDTGVGPCVTKRAEIGNAAHANAVLAIHGDGAPASGHGFAILEPEVVKGHNAAVVPVSDRLGLALRNAYHAGTGIPFSTYLGKDGFSQRGDLGGLNLSTVPAVFIECGNMRNAGDAKKMKTPAFRQRIAQALANGFDTFLG
jgi:N-acetylmuramoyl-L-alanine amidase